MSKGNQGKFAEFLALQYLRLKGYALVSCNYITGRGTGAGEIDIIVKNQNTLAFVEVNTVIGKLLRNYLKFLNALRYEQFHFVDNLFHWSRSVLACDDRNSTIGTTAVASFRNL